MQQAPQPGRQITKPFLLERAASRFARDEPLLRRTQALGKSATWPCPRYIVRRTKPPPTGRDRCATVVIHSPLLEEPQMNLDA